MPIFNSHLAVHHYKLGGLHRTVRRGPPGANVRSVTYRIEADIHGWETFAGAHNSSIRRSRICDVVYGVVIKHDAKGRFVAALLSYNLCIHGAYKGADRLTNTGYYINNARLNVG